MDLLTFERRHAGGFVAQVYRETEGAGYRPAVSPFVELLADADAWPYHDTIDAAQAAADAAAHPGCTGHGCGQWRAVVSVRPLE